jgi:hypothetical protein
MISPPIRAWAASGVLAGALALSGCGSDEETTTAATPTRTPAETATPAAAASLPADLRGSWQRTMTERDWKSAGKGYPLGTWRLDAARDGAVGVYLPRTDAVDFSTEFVASGEQLTIESIPVCPGETGRYAWHASAKELTLSVVADDACAQRAALFGGTWRRRH